MEGLDLMGGISTIFGFLAVCLVMIWKVISDKKDGDKVKENSVKITQILDYITTEREENRRITTEMQKSIETLSENQKEIVAMLGELRKNLAQKPRKKAQKHQNNDKNNED